MQLHSEKFGFIVYTLRLIHRDDLTYITGWLSQIHHFIYLYYNNVVGSAVISEE